MRSIRKVGKDCAQGCPIIRECFKLMWKSTELVLFYECCGPSSVSRTGHRKCMCLLV